MATAEGADYPDPWKRIVFAFKDKATAASEFSLRNGMLVLLYNCKEILAMGSHECVARGATWYPTKNRKTANHSMKCNLPRTVYTSKFKILSFRNEVI